MFGVQEARFPSECGLLYELPIPTLFEHFSECGIHNFTKSKIHFKIILAVCKIRSLADPNLPHKLQTIFLSSLKPEE